MKPKYVARATTLALVDLCKIVAETAAVLFCLHVLILGKLDLSAALMIGAGPNGRVPDFWFFVLPGLFAVLIAARLRKLKVSDE